MSDKRLQRNYTAVETDRALSAVVFHDGNVSRAAKALKSQGLEVPASTLRGWMRTKQDRYAQLRDKLLPEIHAKVAEEHTELARENMDVERIYLGRMRKEAGEVPVRDLANFSRNAATGAGIHADKAIALRDRLPGGAPMPQRSLREIMASLKEAGVTRVEVNVGKQAEHERARYVDSTASEVEPDLSSREDTRHAQTQPTKTREEDARAKPA
jgi:hypothetical protein